ncbi:hypothetical protein [Dactylosporangium sp. NPDC051541]|uniref:hypothetical protein n=1 Tax=Dactylosporangium sp. NPDC051541 TaxID=3363977 RepID=UPI003793DA9B
MFKRGWSGSWLLIGLIGSVLLRGTLWVVTVLNVGPLLGPVDLLLVPALGHTIGTAIWLGDIVASFLFAVATGVACQGLRRDRGWAYRLGKGLARCYVASNAATATVCGVLVMSGWGLLAFPFVLYIASIAVAIMAVRQLQAHRGSAMVVGITSLRRLAACRSLVHEPGPPEPVGQG